MSLLSLCTVIAITSSHKHIVGYGEYRSQAQGSRTITLSCPTHVLDKISAGVLSPAETANNGITTWEYTPILGPDGQERSFLWKRLH